MKTLLVFALMLCAATTARAETQTFLAYDFEFEHGSVLPEVRIAYETQGNLDPARDNAILANRLRRRLGLGRISRVTRSAT